MTLPSEARTCHRCGKPAKHSQRGHFWNCDFHAALVDMALRASSSSILVLKKGELWDYKTDVLIEFMEQRLATIGVKP